MTAHRPETRPSTTTEQPLQPGTPAADEQIAHDIQAVNEQLLIAGLREHTLADQLRHQLAFTTAITTSLGEGVYVLDIAGCCTYLKSTTVLRRLSRLQATG